VATLHFIYGKPGAGKTTLARALAASVPAVAVIEDAWLAALAGPISSVEDYRAAARRIRTVIEPLAIQILGLGTSVVFDFAGNTVAHRSWVRSIFEAAGADHALHVLEVPDAECKRRLRERNATRPPGLYFGDVAEALFDAIVPHIAPPTPTEGFTIMPR
jgi:predicted kinase